MNIQSAWKAKWERNLLASRSQNEFRVKVSRMNRMSENENLPENEDWDTQAFGLWPVRLSYTTDVLGWKTKKNEWAARQPEWEWNETHPEFKMKFSQQDERNEWWNLPEIKMRCSLRYQGVRRATEHGRPRKMNIQQVRIGMKMKMEWNLAWNSKWKLVSNGMSGETYRN
jgi:hypothetical protein